MQYILVMRNNELINKCILLWYVDVLVSILPFRKISRAALVILSYLSCYLHVSRRDRGYGWMHFAGSREFQDLSWSSLWLLPLDLMDLLWPHPPWWDAISRRFMNRSVKHPCWWRHQVSRNGYGPDCLPLWQNLVVRIGNKPIYCKLWSSKGIRNVRHWKSWDSLLFFSEFKERFDVKTNFLIYHGLTSCI